MACSSHITLKLGTFINFEAFFPAVSIDFRWLVHVTNVEKTEERPIIWRLMGVWVISEKKYSADWFRGEKNLARKYLPYNGFVCQEKKIYHQGFRKKKFLPKPNHPSPPLPPLPASLKSQMAGPYNETVLISRHFVKGLLLLRSRLSKLTVTLWL